MPHPSTSGRASGSPQVLIVGAGPTGLVLALWLTKLGIDVRIIDKTEGPGTTSRALAVHARTLELYQQLDLTGAVLTKGYRVPAVNMWARGRRRARVSFADTGVGQTPYPFLHIFPQDEHEALLVERLEAMGVRVERRTELIDFTESANGVAARLHGPDGNEQSCDALFIAGCDGARSVVREKIDAGFPGGTYQHIFYVADVEAVGPPMNGELNVDLDTSDFVALFPLADRERVRLIGTIKDERAERVARGETLKFDDIDRDAMDHLKLEVRKVNWFSTYRVHHRVAHTFRKGRAFLLGDAAHIHSPVGGQGMNTGIGDAINLAWKLAAVIKGNTAPGEKSEALLNTYEPERIAFARRLVNTTDNAFKFVTADGPLANFIRMWIAPYAFAAAVRVPAFRRFMYRTVSQMTINYRHSPLSEGRAGKVLGGDRLPWAKVAASDNYDSLRTPKWQIHVYGTATSALQQWTGTNKVPLHVYPWNGAYSGAGLIQNAVYLIRPDSYTALLAHEADPNKLDAYFASRGLRPAG